ncbi:MAG: septum formation inhibitor Maf [Desulfobacterales bacterium]|jgi:septum formation protein|nr:septum formation inhibitor Maf [Desulfobacteraceae bacterium]MBT4365112.1 septum formation inhibitor Maf [Desulfobacteraceae bacterium]MBT7085565.1 septum formation inhibitor Maf [Desulfobacterales bacterium]MBT7697506.1 septum formation inhibitor Maf [Desulfobacterales bacterium]
MQNSNKDPIIILASQSPRREYLLKQAGLKFSIIPSDVDEDLIPVTIPSDYVKILAEAKARGISGKYPDKWVIGADTIVLINGEILGKPDSVDDARSMLNSLSGKVHHVYTGFAIFCMNKKHFYSEFVKTDVLFKKLSQEEIEWYIHTREPFDKAGAYAIQGLGTFIVKNITGSYTNVVGLPVCEVIEHLIKEKVININEDVDSENYK